MRLDPSKGRCNDGCAWDYQQRMATSFLHSGVPDALLQRPTGRLRSYRKAIEMANEETKQENYFDIHEHFESIEEFELELSRVYDAFEDAMDVALESNLPKLFTISLMQQVVDACKYDTFKEADKLLNISDLLDFIHDQRSDQGE